MRLGGLKQQVILAKHTTYKIGGPADYFVGIKSIEELKKALRFADDNSFELWQGNKENLKAIVFDHVKHRQARHRLPSCGSVFKNYLSEDGSVLHAGAVIEACGLVGKTRI